MALFFGVIRLGNSGIQLVAARGVAALILVINSCGSVELLFQAVGPDKRRRPVHFIKIPDFLRDLDKTVLVVELLLHQLVTENRRQIGFRHRLQRSGM